MYKLILGGLLLSFLHAVIAAADVTPLYDAHIHYSQDMWQSLPPQQAVALLKEQGITRALVSATPAQGAEKLWREDPQLVVPMLRPYKSRRHRYFWFRDPRLKSFLLQQMARLPYRGFGEFHVFGQDMDREPVAQMIQLAREHHMVLHAHTDLAGMNILLHKAPDLAVMWAHAGYDVPIHVLVEMLQTHPRLTLDLSLRAGMLDNDGQLTPPWKQFLTRYPDRFVLGTDTYKPIRWAELPDLIAADRVWLHQLPPAVADKIARHNLDRLFSEPQAD